MPCVRESFALGKRAEMAVRARLESSGLTVEANESKKRSQLREWDLKTWVGQPRHEVLLEVKYDLMASRTGNMAIEYGNTRSGEPSGILATRADLWVHCLALDRLYVCSTSALRRWFEREPYVRDLKGAGDDNASLRLYPTETLLTTLFTELVAGPDLPGVLEALTDG